MALTRDFKATIVDRVRRDPGFARAMLDEAATLFLNGEPHMARLILRDLVNATIGFEALSSVTATPLKPSSFLKRSCAMRRENVPRVLACLPARERGVIEMRYGITGGRSRTLEEVGRAFNITRERVRQIENRTLKKLQTLPEAQLLREAS